MPAERHFPHDKVIVLHEAAMFGRPHSTKASHRQGKTRFTPFWAHVGADRDPPSYLASVHLSVATLLRYAAAR